MAPKNTPSQARPRITISGVPNSGAWAHLALRLLSAAGPFRFPPSPGPMGSPGAIPEGSPCRRASGKALPAGAAEHAAFLKRLGKGPFRPLLIVREREEDLEDVADALKALAPVSAPPTGGRFDRGGSSVPFFGEDPKERLASLERDHRGAEVALATAAALSVGVPTKAEYARRRLRVYAGAALARGELLKRLSALGYQRVDFVESPGEYAARGAVVDFFPFEPLEAVRVLYDGDTVTTLRVFDPQTQTSRPGTLGEAVAAPVREKESERSLGESLAEGRTWLCESGIEPPAGVRRVIRVGPDTGQEAVPFGAVPADWWGGLEPGGRPSPAPSGKALRAGGGLEAVAKRCRQLRKEGLRVLLFSMNRGEDERIQGMLEELNPAGSVQFLVGPLRQGFVDRGSGLACLATAEIFGRSYRQSRLLKPAISGRMRVRWRELKKGDFVVHELYGISRYLGLEAVTTSGRPVSAASGELPEEYGSRMAGGAPSAVSPRDEGVMDCLRLEFRGGDSLFVPMTDFKCVQKYMGAEGHRPRLSSLDTRTWSEVKKRVREAVRDMAERLLKTAAARAARPGHAFPEDSRMEREFGESFPFEETPDQLRTIGEVKGDMTAPRAMDRVVVGDVGFGKTEVAMRAALKCAAGLRQAAVLVPTTILADQHARTFRKRFAEYPVRIEMLSRFQSKAEQRELVRDLAGGKIDVMIGTHRLLSKDIRFKDLGLLVIDEEHRFGVKHKEVLKQLKTEVDCLTLSATPIPRTLHQGLSGLRAVSLISSAPSGRQPTVTEVRAFDERHVKAAIEAELSRDGQVFYVHNRVRSLPQAEKRLRDLLPGVRIAVAHGQMRSDRLEKTMWDFFSRKYDVLVASTIIESGLDIPSVNTLLIENAQEFGLSQLYQLRGRIGRERRRAYCYLYYPADVGEFRALSEDARKRLEALREFGELGAGLALAMRDLEIRGAGDLLGAKQHGFLNAVGVEFYAELVESEVRKLKGAGRPPAEPESRPAHLDLAIPAYLPDDFLPGDFERIRTYKRMLAAESFEELRAELMDLSGPLPPVVENLFRVLRVRRMATGLGVRSLVQRGGRVEIYFYPDAKVPTQSIMRWMSAYGERIEFLRSPEGDGLKVFLDRKDPLTWVSDFLDGACH